MLPKNLKEKRKMIMGQRLVITVYDGKTDERVANVYQHWSAYTDSAAVNTLVILELMNEMMEKFPEANAKRIAVEAMLRSNKRANITYEGYWQQFLHNENNIPENLRGFICKNFYYFIAIFFCTMSKAVAERIRIAVFSRTA